MPTSSLIQSGISLYSTISTRGTSKSQLSPWLGKHSLSLFAMLKKSPVALNPGHSSVQKSATAVLRSTPTLLDQLENRGLYLWRRIAWQSCIAEAWTNSRNDDSRLGWIRDQEASNIACREGQKQLREGIAASCQCVMSSW